MEFSKTLCLQITTGMPCSKYIHGQTQDPTGQGL